MQSECYIIGIAGGSGSGKTSFIHTLKDRFSDDDLCIISQDNYYHDRDNQSIDENGIINFDLPSSIIMDDFYHDVKQLAMGRAVSRKEYTFNNELKEASMITLNPGKVLIAEGLFVFTEPRLKELYDLKIMVHATDDKKIIRRIKRDRIERNYPLEDVLYRYENHVIPSYNQHILPHLEDADIIVNNNHSFDKALDVMTTFIQSKIK